MNFEYIHIPHLNLMQISIFRHLFCTLAIDENDDLREVISFCFESTSCSRNLEPLRGKRDGGMYAVRFWSRACLNSRAASCVSP